MQILYSLQMVASCFVLLFSSFVSKLVRSVASKGRILLLVMLGFQAWDIIFEMIRNDLLYIHSDDDSCSSWKALAEHLQM